MRIETPDIYEDLERKLITASFESGQKLKPAELQGLYGCSANTVRDVLLRLSMVGLVTFENQRGFRVRRASVERQTDVTKFRILLEQEAAAGSMRNGGVAWESRMSAAHAKLKHIESQLAKQGMLPENINLWSDAELEFHETLISACESQILRDTYAGIYLQFRQQMVSLQPDFSSKQFTRIVREHQNILDAALARDEAGCKAAIADHLSRHLHVAGASSSK